MATYTLDAMGLKCPQPILKVAIKSRELQPGDMLEVIADCHSFPTDVEAWCQKTGKTLLYCGSEGDHHKAQIQF